MEATSESKPKRYTCIGILAHVDAGKTTLSEGLLYESGSIRSMGRVDNKDAFWIPMRLRGTGGLLYFQSRQCSGSEKWKLHSWIHRVMWIFCRDGTDSAGS